jgi:NAD(P)-dependent dehydrogenase (short-subunit alcohol dehydrogenase family)
MQMSQELSTKIALVTGGASKIGQACGLALAKAGAHIVLTDLDADTAQERAANISSEVGRPVPVIPADIRAPDQCVRLIQQAYDQFNRLDILVNGAGMFEHKMALEMNPDRWQQTFDVNLHGVYYCAQAFARLVIRQSQPATIVNISSISSTHNIPGRAAYSASKAALNSLTQALALEWARYNIRVNAVAPSHVNVAKIRRAAQDGQLDLPAIEARIPMARIAEPEEVAEVVLFLCSDQSRFVTGQIVFVDGGYTVNGGW